MKKLLLFIVLTLTQSQVFSFTAQCPACPASQEIQQACGGCFSNLNCDMPLTPKCVWS